MKIFGIKEKYFVFKMKTFCIVDKAEPGGDMNTVKTGGAAGLGGLKPSCLGLPLLRDDWARDDLSL